MIRKVFVIGNHIQALGVVRLIKKINLPVFLFVDYKVAIPRFSRYVDKIINYSTNSDLLKKIDDYKDKDKDTLIIATSDNIVDFLKKNYDNLINYFWLSIANPSITDICHNKIKTYKAALKANIPIPETFFPDNIDEVKVISKKLSYPVILKPAIMYKFFSETGKKVYFCKTPNELLEYYEKMSQIISPDEIMIQEFLSGGAKSLFSFGAVAANGEILAGFSANRIRQNPMDFGVSTTFAVSVINDKLEEYAARFLREIGYSGFAEVEFMYDKRVNEFKLLEINPRTWKWHTLANRLGINLVEIMIKNLNGEKVDQKIVRINNKAWIESITDTYIAVSELLKGNMSLSEYFATLKLEKEFAVWNIKDPLPSIVYLFLIPYYYFKRR